jgi:hypothetical protein
VVVSEKRLAQAVREACVQAALQAYEDAGMSGLCHEGRWECAVSAMRALDLAPIVERERAQGEDQGEKHG